MGRWECEQCMRKLQSNQRKHVWDGNTICSKCHVTCRETSGSIGRKLRMAIASSKAIEPVRPITRNYANFHNNRENGDLEEIESMDIDSSEQSCASSQDVSLPDSTPLMSPFSGEDSYDSTQLSNSSTLINTEASIELSQPSSQGSSRDIKMVNVRGMKSAIKSQRRCFVCKRSSGRTVIGDAAIKNAFARKQIRIPTGNRCCTTHLQNGLLNQEALDGLQAHSDDSQLDEVEVSNWISTLTNLAIGPRIDFAENSDLSDADYKMLTGFPKHVFEDILNHCGTIKNSSNRSRRNAVGMLLMQLRMNLTQRQLAFLFRVPNISTVSDTLDSVLEALEKTFLPKYLGFEHITRKELIARHSVKSFNKLLRTTNDEEEDDNDAYTGDDVLKLIFDCTYLYHQKPSDFELQRKTYCVHKAANLVKPMMVVTETGHILEASDVYYSDAENNDAAILRHMMQNGPLLDYFEVGDRAIFDRGFRDVVEFTEDHAIHAHMPPLLSRGAKQFSAIDGNTARQVTMIRWVVEAVNGRVKKKFSFFDDVIEASYLPKIGRLFRLACAFINAYAGPLFTESEDHTQLVEAAILKLGEENKLFQMLVAEDLLRRRSVWTEVADSDVPHFPRLTPNDLKTLALGVYQPKLGKLYARQHLASSTDFKIFIHHSKPNLLKSKIQARFSRRRHYNVWIEYEANGVGPSAITGYYCCCRSGARTLGTCSHVASVLWYLGYARHDPDLKTGNLRDLCSTILSATRNMNDEEDGSDTSEDEEN